MTRTTIIAHRGLEDTHPENTIAGYRAAFDLGFGAEVDVAMTADQQLVAIHDDTVDRTTNGSGRVAQMTADELRQLDAGGWKGNQFAGEKIPTLSEVFELAAQCSNIDPVLVLDVKTLQPGIINMICGALLEHGLLATTVGVGIISKSVDVRRRFYEGSADFQCSAETANSDSLPLAAADPYSKWLLTPFVPTHADIETAHSAGKRVIAAGKEILADIDEAVKTLENGVDAVMTSHPAAIHARLNG